MTRPAIRWAVTFWRRGSRAELPGRHVFSKDIQ
jgi:hypothetical protein